MIWDSAEVKIGATSFSALIMGDADANSGNSGRAINHFMMVMSTRFTRSCGGLCEVIEEILYSRSGDEESRIDNVPSWSVRCL